MRHHHRAITASLVASILGVAALGTTAAATGVGGATWTPVRSVTSTSEGRHLIAGDTIVFRTDSTWDREQVQGLAAYLERGLRFTHEINDRSGRLSATGYWATNYPDPAFDRDDDDGDGRWEEAEVIAGATTPRADQVYTALVPFSRWHGKRAKGRCDWAWDRRRGRSEVLSQLSRYLFGEWQAERYTLSYDALEYPRVGERPDVPGEAAGARCRDQRPGVNQDGYVVTFSRPLRWMELLELVSVGSGKWTAFEAIGSHPQDALTWTCGGPVEDADRMRPCRDLGMRVRGVTASVGYFDELAAAQLRGHPDVAAVEPLQDALTDLLSGVSGFGIEPPGLTVNDRYWELRLAD